MSLIQIEDSQEEQPKKISNEIAIGIDLGTTNSVGVCYLQNNIHIIPNDGKNLLSSILSYSSNNGFIVGKEQSQTNIKSIKRLMGKTLREIDVKYLPYEIYESKNNLQVKISKEISLSPEEISSHILKQIKINAEKHLNKKVTKAVITVPAYFDDAARGATKLAAKLAGLEVIRLINEPTAAALAYGLDKSIEGTYMIYDFGGGTFDVSILKMQKGIFKVISTMGDNHLGGDDIDNAILNKILINNNLNFDSFSYIEKLQIINIAKHIKEYLSTHEEYNKIHSIKNHNIECKINITEYHKLIDPILQKTINIAKQAIQNIKSIDDKNIKAIVLVGGSTKNPYVNEVLQKEFQLSPMSSLNPEEVVARGAGYSAAMLMGQIENSLLLDVTPLSLGIEIMGGIVEKIIPRNTTIPTEVKQEFTTAKDGQSKILLHVLQGERELVKDVRSLGKFTLSNIASMSAGMARIQVSFKIDANGILTVSAKDKASNKQQTVEFNPSWGLTMNEVTNILKDSIAHAKDDINKKQLMQAKVTANTLIITTEKSIKQYSKLLSKEQLNKINQQMDTLKKIVNDNNLSIIEKNITILQNLTEDLAVKMLKESVNNE